MKFTDIFINKPVLAMVVSLFVLLLGLRSFSELNVRQYPELQNAVVTVTTTYYGADADLIQGFITTPLEREVASAEGIDYLTSTSAAGASVIQAYIRLDHDANEALTQIAAKVNKLRSQLPAESEDPVIDLQQGQQIAAMYVSFASERLDNNQITDYLSRAVEPRIATIPGVQRAEIMGAGTFAMRVWMKPDRMTAQQVTASDIHNALQANNVLSALGSTKGQMVAIDLTARTDLRSAEEFRRLVVREHDGAIVRLGDVADVHLGSESYGTSVRINGDAATFMGIYVSPDANSLDVIEEVRKAWDEEIVPQLPEGIVATIPYDSTESIQGAIDEVVRTIVEAVLIVIVVIFLFLGSLRSVLIPAITVPLSLVGALFLMLLMGFTINLLTLLAMVLAIGIVVDDAIIVLENIHRHIEDGMSPHDAAIKGARELAWPVVAMTTTLVAVYLPIGFQGGLTGVLFTEFAFTLAGAVLLSGIIALTLSPMMCAKFLKAHAGGHGKTRLERWLDARFERLRGGYERRLHGALDTKVVIGVFGALVLASCAVLYVTAPKEPAPLEDEGFVFAIGSADAYTTLDYVERYTEEVNAIARDIPEINDFFLFNGGFGGGGASNSAMAGFVLKPWAERTRSTNQVLQQDLQPKLAQVTGLNTFALVPPSLPSAGGDGGGEFLVLGIGSLQQLDELSEAILRKAMESRRFIFLDKDLKIDKPRIEVQIDREKAAMLGIDMRTLAADMAAMLSGGYTNRFAMENRSYRVIPQVQRSDRLNAQQLENYYTRTRDGQLVPLSTLVTLKETTQPQTLKRFQQLNAVGITFAPRPGVSKGEALRVLEQAASEVLPQGYSVDYAGESRQFKQEGATMLVTLAFALVAIFLVLAAQFESFRDALIMLITVPMAISGALLVLNALALLSGVLQFAGIEAFPGMSINIYTQVGLVTLVGVISKHGILIVEFANKLQRQGLSKREAIEQAAGIRLRPVLMTTAALVFAMVPLLMAKGPGAAARFSMGTTIAAGMTLGTLFTLFVLPAMYLFLARDHGHDRAAAAEGEASGEPEPQAG
ncbi:multidrug efflux protein [Pseudoxanthomonas broegbernensis]|uniref:Multidrug efflux protein n=1 Tax=Pseudoxanthomonas broegbernensis TaxID=83619 RepID=A0A7V8K6K8_9GAMM|nr:efflux RND transporter permease subunit [Pseudoxanthomonas broegbernensis]KAF1685415.1 multidrug efflux protein [Pseudoxanthomonas broegbernensis]MBB6064457.1 multidrug efflux pump [Pseudoxanthomonas broegbernensis]